MANKGKNKKFKKSRPKKERDEIRSPKEKLHAHKKIANPDDLVCPWCLFAIKDYESLKTRETIVSVWEVPRKELGNWAEGNIMCTYHQIRVYPDLWFKTLRILLDSIEGWDPSERNRIYYLERDKYQSIKAILIKELKDRRTASKEMNEM